MARTGPAEVTVRAEPLGYEAVAYYDRVMDRTLSVLRAQPGAQVSPPAHWGVYVFSSQPEIDVVIHAPHPIYYTYSDLMAAQAFQGSRARALFVAGAHRHASGNSPPIADVARYVPSVFNDIHCSTLTALDPRAVIQFQWLRKHGPVGPHRTRHSQHRQPDPVGRAHEG
ncbi:MAG TPA: hypothetical protein VG455_09600 [Acidimicrobiales bacterium]|nr:hypothetical protein [Acidimicrobiales bacterium]